MAEQGEATSKSRRLAPVMTFQRESLFFMDYSIASAASASISQAVQSPLPPLQKTSSGNSSYLPANIFLHAVARAHRRANPLHCQTKESCPPVQLAPVTRPHIIPSTDGPCYHFASIHRLCWDTQNILNHNPVVVRKAFISAVS